MALVFFVETLVMEGLVVVVARHHLRLLLLRTRGVVLDWQDGGSAVTAWGGAMLKVLLE